MLKTAHEWGYRWHESGLIEDLTPTQLAWMQLAEQAEGYIKEQAMDDRGGRGSLSRSQYDHRSSREEWAQQFQ